MAIQTHLSKAPITEALIDIKVRLPIDVDINKLEPMGKIISNQYPKKQDRIRFEGRIDFKLGETPKHKDPLSLVDGFMYISSDEKYVVQTRLDGFTLSRLKPYETWERLRDEAQKLWKLYLETTSPEIIKRVALRYINRLELPPSMHDFSEYLASPPTVPKGLPQKLASFLNRFIIPFEDIDAFAIITQSFESIERDVVPIILDIDVFREGEFELNKGDAWELLEKFRNIKNDVFFESITEKTKELYQ